MKFVLRTWWQLHYGQKEHYPFPSLTSPLVWENFPQNSAHISDNYEIISDSIIWYINVTGESLEALQT